MTNEQNDIIKFLKDNPLTENKEVLLDFIKNNDELYSRNNLFGHITASAFIVDEKMDKALLILHKKYNKWLSPGGHVDDGENGKQASIRETQEETGLNQLKLLSENIFDIDIHRIPESNKNGKIEPAHWHFDVRYIHKAPKDAIVDLNLFEAKGFQWVELEKLKNVDDISISRQAKKAKELISKIKRKRKLSP